MPARVAAWRDRSSRSVTVVLVVAFVATAAVVPTASFVAGAEAPDHLVVSEVVTGGASASDEFVEIHNPTPNALPLEGLELLYVSSTGGTVTRRVTWAAGAPLVPAHGHVLAANGLGAFSSIADVLYSGGMAATGGSVALRIQDAVTAIDAVGWGTAASAWMEGAPAIAPGVGESIERLPGGTLGSGMDTGANVADFVLRSVPDPQNLGSDPTPGSGAPTPSPVPPPTSAPTPPPTPTPGPLTTPTPGPAALSILAARGMPDGTTVTVEGTSLTGSDFSDGGGYMADATGAIAVLPDADVFARGRALRVTGEIDDRFGQRTLRVGPTGIVDTGAAGDPPVADVATGSVGETVEGTLVRIAAAIIGPATTLTSGLAFDIDDGSGATRLVIGSATGIDATGWVTRTELELIGVVGQRDSTGTGAVGYRVQPRDPADVIAVHPPAAPTPGASGDPTVTPRPSSSPDAGVISIAAAREAPRNARVRVQGTVTLASGIVDEQTAVIQDGSGAIVLRLSDEAGSLLRGQRVDVTGPRSTKSGMETIRVTSEPRQLGEADEPSPVTVTTGAAGETLEARLVLVRGGLVSAARRASSGTVSMEIDDGSGPLRVVAGASLALDHGSLSKGTWIEVRGVLGQETTGAQPQRGYRVWLRGAGDIRITAETTQGAAEGEESQDHGASGAAADVGDLGDVGSSLDGDAIVGATLVAGRWRELGIAGVLWDGERVVGLAAGDATRLATALGTARPPVSLELRGLRAGGTATHGLPVVAMAASGAVVARPEGEVTAPATSWPQPEDAARWFAAVGRLEAASTRLRLHTTDGILEIDRRCDAVESMPRGVVTATGLALPGRSELVVPCGGVVPGAHLQLAGASPPPARLSGGTGRPEPTAATPAQTSGAIGASLLAVAALVLTGIAAWMRWRPVDPSPLATSDRAPREPDDHPLDDPSASPPVLQLVTLPRERSP